MAAPLPASAPAPSDPIICKLQAIASPESSHEAPLAVLWGRCYTIYTDLDHLTAQAVRSEEAVSTLAACLDLLTLSEQRVENQGIFSSNESEEDLSTGDMRYLLVPFYAAELLSNSPARPGPAGQAQRASAVRKAQRTYGRFLARAEQYQMLGELGSSIFKALESSGGAMDANTRRSLKVDKFKREKALKSAINELQDKQAAAAAKEQDGVEAGPDYSSTGSRRLGTHAVSGGGTGGSRGSMLEEDEERGLWKLNLEMAVLRALEQQAMLQQEEELLVHGLEATEQSGSGASSSGRVSTAAGVGPGGRAAQGPVTEAEKAAMLGALRGIVADLGSSRRDQMRTQVFRPGHAAPTQSLDEFAAQEMADAQRREARARQGREAEAARRAGMDEDEQDDEDKHQARARDDYKDAHPFGHGNSKLKPCG